MLDDIGKAQYKKLKIESDGLLKIRCAIKCKKTVIEALTEQWLYLESEDLEDNAESVYRQKLKIELELQQLERDEKASIKRIGGYVKSQTRSA